MFRVDRDIVADRPYLCNNLSICKLATELAEMLSYDFVLFAISPKDFFEFLDLFLIPLRTRLIKCMVTRLCSYQVALLND